MRSSMHLFFLFSILLFRDNTLLLSEAAAQTKSIGKVTAAKECKWAKKTKVLKVGDDVSLNQRIQLQEGTLSCLLEGGHQLMFTGPCDATLQMADQVTLRAGMFTMKAPEVTGFDINTSCGRISSIEAEIVVNFDSKKALDIKVSQGSVRVKTVRPDGFFEEIWNLKPGERVQIDPKTARGKLVDEKE